ncbi:hypothetical protein PHYBLDRAFT_148426 [Phycomyces blakesleeanus NRRL 1555(-)]|uniref:Uncharacterized protein n=1 Tax=Phycomyces blakesleeanus (strain ATCC 8743b / DSM 1359 / FGSC 10004 / NBRC 33097 / NRRL 1555) TaxID=763407 RepID=A0A163A1W1_PHYB8|nr:hypothetical protein PHYBLDRAFT_148426 [Phycomyces blakesleeanus NRRL 1555(-)]OAD70511.1 hypothetical protein PHYBLDRAFT_148426 [Phycomyces blakesleeanus NRRL 1555(-)]|eukprot:XP_018288551.1 hypothetical protein PHYBLDRAFT_148426 [Phycomyces blakesleeanus NRRL 1555(-)]
MNYTRSDAVHCPVSRAKAKKLPPRLSKFNMQSVVPSSLSILNIEKTQEPIIKLLYGIATPVLRDKTDNKEARQEAIEIICRKSVPQINRTVSFVLENVSEPKAQKRTSECLQNELDLIEELHKRYIPTSLSSTGISTSNHWQFINNYRKEHRAKMNWTACYEAEKDIDLFGKYTSLKSGKGTTHFRTSLSTPRCPSTATGYKIICTTRMLIIPSSSNSTSLTSTPSPDLG